MLWDEYKKEIELIEKQNNVECDLYGVIYSVLIGIDELRTISIRNVSNRKRTINNNEKIFWGVEGFPDFVFLDKEYEPEKEGKYLYGAIEAKKVGESIMINLDDISQAIGHLLYFNFLVYTNGYEWHIYQNKWDNVDYKEIIDLRDITYSLKGNTKEVRDRWKEIDKKLYNKFKIDESILCEKFLLKKKNEDEQYEWSKEEWDRLITYLSKDLLGELTKCIN